jgi:selenocysteine-specific elongation factor
VKGIIGTGGHIDHGKTALVAVLTGEDTDRLPEERRRGISIDLGFAHLDAGDDTLGIVDVPGHEDFIRNMLAGATGIDLLLLVVAADEGVMPQTREHIAIAELLGVRDAVVALTKQDLVDDAWLALAREDVEDLLSDTVFAGARIVPTSAATGEGVEELRSAIVEGFRGTRGRVDDLFRLPVDRTFTVRGTGTVATGTVWSGRLRRDAVVRVEPDGPEARVRALQVHGRDVDAVEAGERAAIALTGVDRAEIERGMSVITDPAWESTRMVTVSARILPGSHWSIEQRQRVRIHLGTAEVMARAVLLETDRMSPGESGWVQLRLERPLLARSGDRAVIRSYSPVTTIGGAIVVEAEAPKRTRIEPVVRRRLEALAGPVVVDRVTVLLEAAGTRGLDTAAIPIRTGATPAEVEASLESAAGALVAGRAYDGEAVAEVRQHLVAAVRKHHADHPLQSGIDPERLRQAAPGRAHADLVGHALAALTGEGILEQRGASVALAGFAPALTDRQTRLRDRAMAVLTDAGVAAPRVDELAASLGDPSELRDLLALLDAEGRVVRVEHDLYVAAATLERATETLRNALGGRDDLRPGDFRAILKVSRRHLIPILEHLDRTGVTVRRGEGRTVPDRG